MFIVHFCMCILFAYRCFLWQLWYPSCSDKILIQPHMKIDLGKCKIWWMFLVQVWSPSLYDIGHINRFIFCMGDLTSILRGSFLRFSTKADYKRSCLGSTLCSWYFHCQCNEIFERQIDTCEWYGPLTRYVKLPVAHAPGMPGTFSPQPTSKETAS